MRIVLLALLAGCAAGRLLSEECSGYTPEDCRRLPGCKTCWDGRVDCYPADQTIYGNFWCEAAVRNDACEGKSEDVCNKLSSCVFCKSAAVGDECYLTSEAKELPSAVFSCAWKTAY